jgi:hypothetical protein
MAFNPFDVFRRNQRVLFAVLTVFIMFMFTLSFGAGDFFTTFPKWLGAKRGYGEVMAVVDGSRVHRSQLGEIGLRRDLANAYMFEAGVRASSNIAKYVVDGATKLGEEPKRAVQEFLAARQSDYLDPQLRRQFEMYAQYGIPGGPTREEVIGSRDYVLPRTRELLLAVANDPKAKDEDRDVARSALYLMGLDLQLGGAAGNSKLYFSNQPNKTDRDQLNFLLWLKKADDLGIVYTTADVNQLASDEFRGKATAEELQAALNVVKGTRAYADNPDNLVSALADEFRVRAAQSAVMGANLVRAPGTLAVGYDAPYDYFEYYKGLTSPARFGVAVVPAEAFLPAVEGKPSESELRKLYEKARGVEADPARPDVGLRKPREIKVEFMEVKGDEPFYQKAAADALPKLEAYAYLTAALTPATGGWPAALAAVAVGTLRDPLLAAEADGERARAERDIDGEWYTKPGNPYADKIHIIDSSVVRPQVAAVAVGAVAANLAAGGAWPTAGLVAEAAAATLDWQGRATAMAALLSPPFSVADRLGAVADHLARTARPLAAEVVRPRLAENAKKAWARRITGADLQEFQKKLTELAAKPDKAEVRAYVEGFTKERGLKLGASTGFRDQYTIGDDPGLAPLKAKQPAPTGGVAPSFGRTFFYESMPGRPEQEARGLYQLRQYPPQQFDLTAAPPEPSLVWRTEEKPAENPRDLNPTVRAQAEAGWKKLEARKKAKAAAEALAKECGNLGTDEATISKNFLDKIEQFKAKLPTPEAKAGVAYFEMRDVAPLVTSSLPLAGRTSASPFEITPTPQVPYPTPEMTRELLAARAKGPSATAVLADQPTDRYYVAVKYGQADRVPTEFVDSVYAPTISGGAAGAVFRRHQEELRKQARETAIGLLKAEFRVDKESGELDRRADSAGE